MKKIFVTILFFCWVGWIFSQTYNPYISGDFKNIPFEDFSKKIYNEHQIHTYYKPEWVKDIEFSADADSIPLRKILDRFLLPNKLHYTLLPSGSLYILRTKNLITALPDFKSSEITETKATPNEVDAQQEKKYLVGRQANVKEHFVIGKRKASFDKGAVTVQGRITNAVTGEPVPGVTMYVPETGKGSVSNANGIISMPVLPGRINAKFSFIGMKTKEVLLEVYESGSFSLSMEPEMITLSELRIVANDRRKIQGTDMGLEKINFQSIKQLPVLLGEKDIIKVSQLLPGIVSASELSSGVNVRGGNADQNVFYLEDIPLFNTSHSFGFFSAFNSDIVRDFSVYKGNIPAEYGGRLSSVFDVSTRKGNLKKFGASAGISPITAKAVVEGPFQKDKGSFLLSARASYSDWLLKQVNDPQIRNSSASFADFSGSFFYRLGEKDDVNLFLYGSTDDITLYQLNNYAYNNAGGSFKWAHQFAPNLRSELFAIRSAYNFSSENIAIPAIAYQHDYEISHNELKLQFSLLQGLNHKIKFGGSLIYYPINRGEILPLGENSFRKPVNLGKEQGLQSGIFLSDEYKINNWITIYGGIRFNTFTYLGPKKVNAYVPGVAKTEQTVSEVKDYSRGEAIVTYYDPAFRTGLNLQALPNTAFKLSFSQMNQYLFMASNTVTLAPDDQWKMADPHIKPQHSNQFSAGIYHSFSEANVAVSVEAYGKINKNILEYKDGADFVNIPNAEISILQGTQRASGVEFMLEKKTGRIDGWISYTYSRAFVKVDGDQPWERINNGNPYPANYDKPHVLNVVSTYRLSRILILSSSIVYGSGRPVTLPESIYFIDDQPYISFTERNAARIPDYFRADISLTIEGNLKRNKILHSSWNLNVYNITGRKNVQSIFFRSENATINGYKLSIIGVPVFTVSWNVKLGNYATE